MAYNIVKTLFEKKPELVAVHKEAENIDLKSQAARLADSVPSGREEVPRGAGHQGELATRAASRGPAPRSGKGMRAIASRRCGRSLRATNCAAVRRPPAGGTRRRRTARRGEERGGAVATEAPSPATPAPAISEERLRKAVEYIEEEEGADQPLSRRGSRKLTTLLLVGMSLFHLYAAVDIVPAQVLRPVHVGWVLLLVFLLFPVAKRFRNRLMWWDVVLAVARRRDDRLPARRAATISGTATRCPIAADVFFGATFVLLVLEAVRRTSGWIMLVRDHALPRLRLRRPVAPGPVDAPRLRRVEPLGFPLPDARRDLRHRRRRVVIAHHPVHDLRRVPAAVGRGQVLPRLELRGDGRQAQRAPDARSCSRRSCWAGRRAPASRPR